MSEYREVPFTTNNNTVLSEPERRIQVTLDPSCSLQKTVETTVNHYLSSMEGQTITELYDTVLRSIEEPLLSTVLHRTSNNQSEAAKLLGLNRGTLRKKLKRYSLL